MHSGESNAEQWKPGDLATWDYTPPGGYGYVIPVNAVVVPSTAARVLIHVDHVTNGQVTRAVKPEKLRPRKAGKHLAP